MSDEKVLKLAKALRDEAVAAVGGSVAWGRLSAEVRREAIAARAWFRAYSRWDEGISKITVEDIALAYAVATASVE